MFKVFQKASFLHHGFTIDERTTQQTGGNARMWGKAQVQFSAQEPSCNEMLQGKWVHSKATRNCRVSWREAVHLHTLALLRCMEVSCISSHSNSISNLKFQHITRFVLQINPTRWALLKKNQHSLQAAKSSIDQQTKFDRSATSNIWQLFVKNRQQNSTSGQMLDVSKLDRKSTKHLRLGAQPPLSCCLPPNLPSP